MNKLVIIVLSVVSLCFAGNTVKKEISQIKGRLIWLRLEQQMLNDLQSKLQLVEEGRVSDTDTQKIKKIAQDYSELRGSKDKKKVRVMHRKLKNLAK
tara:strand:+ start:630 stop:920 length:291 start_codon:yes stop_codon:yes gene_type:complete